MITPDEIAAMRELIEGIKAPLTSAADQGYLGRKLAFCASRCLEALEASQKEAEVNYQSLKCSDADVARLTEKIQSLEALLDKAEMIVKSVTVFSCDPAALAFLTDLQKYRLNELTIEAQKDGLYRERSTQGEK